MVQTIYFIKKLYHFIIVDNKKVNGDKCKD